MARQTNEILEALIIAVEKNTSVLAEMRDVVCGKKPKPRIVLPLAPVAANADAVPGSKAQPTIPARPVATERLTGYMNTARAAEELPKLPVAFTYTGDIVALITHIRTLPPKPPKRDDDFDYDNNALAYISKPLKRDDDCLQVQTDRLTLVTDLRVPEQIPPSTVLQVENCRTGCQPKESCSAMLKHCSWKAR